MSQKTFDFWWKCGYSAGKARIGIQAFSGPSAYAVAWTRGYIAALTK